MGATSIAFDDAYMVGQTVLQVFSAIAWLNVTVNPL